VNRFEFTRPTAWPTRSRSSEKHDETSVLAGGTDLLSLMKDFVVEPKRLVSLMGIEELRGSAIGTGKGNPGAIALGATTTLDALLANADVKTHWPAVWQAAGGVKSPQLRAMGTIGGELLQRPRCWYFRHGQGLCAELNGESLAAKGDNRYHAVFGNAGPAKFVNASSLAPALIACGATVTVVGPKGTRTLAVKDLYTPPKSAAERELTLAANEIVTSVNLQGPPATKSATYEVRPRQGLDWPLATASVALELDGKTIKSAVVVLGHVAPTPWLADGAAKALVGHAFDGSRARGAAAAVAGATPLSKNAHKVDLAQAPFAARSPPRSPREPRREDPATAAKGTFDVPDERARAGRTQALPLPALQGMYTRTRRSGSGSDRPKAVLEGKVSGNRTHQAEGPDAIGAAPTSAARGAPATTRERRAILRFADSLRPNAPECRSLQGRRTRTSRAAAMKSVLPPSRSPVRVRRGRLRRRRQEAGRGPRREHREGRLPRARTCDARTAAASPTARSAGRARGDARVEVHVGPVGRRRPRHVPAVLIIEAKSTLGDKYHSPLPVRDVLLLDEATTRSSALRAFVKAQLGDLPATSSRSGSSRSRSSSTAATRGCSKLVAGTSPTRPRAASATGRDLRPESTYYPPLTTLKDSLPAFTVERGHGHLLARLDRPRLAQRLSAI
jgi:xanthine dehydrogenase YagS FAD-binding subunit